MKTKTVLLLSVQNGNRYKMLNYTTTYYWSTGDTNCAGVFAFDAVTQKYDLQLIVGWSNG